MKKEVIAYIHTHWDREWYREYEAFRMRLLRVFDNILGMLENNVIPCFYFDGQVSALEDYLEIRPEKFDLIKKLIKSKKLYIGPFYCLVDEFLTDRICFSKNLEIGMSKAIEFGCTDFIGYLPDTFGHSQNVPEILREFGIDKCIVWRGCGDFPAEFKWCGIDTVNLVRGYFNDVFSMNCSAEKKAEFIKKELDKIAEKSGECLLMPIGADHLGVETNIANQINDINEHLENYEIKLSNPFEYFKKVDSNFKNFIYDDELRDNSKTFTLQGCYSSRLDIKKLNVECSYKLDLSTRFVHFTKTETEYTKLIDYAYKLLLQNQAHDSICGCSVDEVHAENKIRYNKILQIANNIIEELKFKTDFSEKMVLNLSESYYSGIVEFETLDKSDGFEKISARKGFESKLLADTQRIPITEDYTNIYKKIAYVEDLKNDEYEFIMQEPEPSDIKVTETTLENSDIKFEIIGSKAFVNGIQMKLVDYIDLGDSYNNAPQADDSGEIFKLKRSKVWYKGNSRASLKLDFVGIWDVVSLIVTLDKKSPYLKFEMDWENSRKNHLLEVCFELNNEICEVLSEDMNTLIKRKFDSDYDIRKNLPQTKGIEVKTNTAPMQRGLLIDEDSNNIGVITKGLTQYEVYKNNLYIPVLRATGSISNPLNPARTTPAGPPLETPDLQMIGKNNAEFYVFFGNENDFNNVMSKIYNYIIT